MRCWRCDRLGSSGEVWPRIKPDPDHNLLVGSLSPNYANCAPQNIPTTSLTAPTKPRTCTTALFEAAFVHGVSAEASLNPFGASLLTISMKAGKMAYRCLHLPDPGALPDHLLVLACSGWL